MADLQALIFDVDGTLADTERDGHRVAFNRAFAEAGLDWDWSVELYGHLLAVTGGKERIRFYLDKYNTGFQRPDDLDGFIADLHRNKTAHYMSLMEEGAIPLRPGVQRLLEQARSAGVPLAIATTTTPENVSALVASTLPSGALDWFTVIGAGDIVPAKKPAPDIYQWVLSEMDLDAKSVIAFEDSSHGVSSAVGAGIDKVVVTVNDYTREQDFALATVVLDQLGEASTPAAVLDGTAVPPDGVVDLDYLRLLL
ncbi:HAD family hydrolase [Thiosocius teredinicola]|uniref:HAD family hydrolase n=1 Tax=Thiosocius teredinicola TaxID=1973002 RepID=UPI00099134D5